MTPGQTASDFFEAVAAKADIGPGEAEELSSEFVRSLSGFVDPSAWKVISEITPVDVDPDGVADRPDDKRTMKSFLLEMSSEEDLATRRAARHARAVAETIRERASKDQIGVLENGLEDELLALFEAGARGELTEPGGLTSETQRRVEPPEATGRPR